MTNAPASFTVPSRFVYGVVGALLIGFGRASSLFWLAPIAAFLGYSLLLLGSYDPLRPNRELSFPSLLSFLSLGSLFQLFWLTSHPYAYMWAVWPLISILLSLPLAFIFSYVIKEQALHEASSSSIPKSHFFLAVLAFLAASYEHFLTLMWPGISFYTAALMLTWHPIGAQLAAFFGRASLSFVIFWSSFEGFFWLATVQQRKRRRPALSYGMLWIFLALLPYLTGGARLAYHAITPLETEPMRLVLCHMEEDPDVFDAPHMTAWDLTTREWEKVLSMLSPCIELSEKADLIVIPEGAIPYSASSVLVDAEHLIHITKDLESAFEPGSLLPALETGRRYTTSIDVAKALATAAKTPVLIGLEGRETILSDGETAPSTFAYNSCFYMPPLLHSPLQHPKGYHRYDKQLLIPFGEYIPMPWMASILAMYGVHGSFVPGKESAVFDLELNERQRTIPFSSLICYEETFSPYAVIGRDQGAHIFITISNDNWFPRSRLKREHMELARLQAIELGVPLARSTNMGVTGAFDYLGHTIKSFESSQDGDNRALFVSIPVPVSPPQTLYFRLHSLFGISAIWILGVISALWYARKRQ